MYVYLKGQHYGYHKSKSSRTVVVARVLRSGGDLMERKEEEKRILVRHGFVNFSRISSSEFLIYKTRF